MKKTYFNLTNGIEFLVGIPFFVRIQSTLCEAKKWDKLLFDLDYGFLLDLALGFEVTVIDASQSKPAPRALYQGVPWIKYALTRRWFGRIESVYVKRCNVASYFDQEYHGLSSSTKRKLDYVGKYLLCKEVKITGCSFPTIHDGNYSFYKTALAQYCATNIGTQALPTTAAAVNAG